MYIQLTLYCKDKKFELSNIMDNLPHTPKFNYSIRNVSVKSISILGRNCMTKNHDRVQYGCQVFEGGTKLDRFLAKKGFLKGKYCTYL